MRNIKEIELIDIINGLPDIESLDCNKEFLNKEYDAFFCALGFEERCLSIPEQLSNIDGFKCKQALYFEYSTNIEDNEINRPRLIMAFEKFADSWTSLQCDNENFTEDLRKLLNKCKQSEQIFKIILDISVCSSKLILSLIKVLLELNINLHIVYSEARTYHPTCEEFDEEPEKWTTEEGFGIAQGVGKVVPSVEYPGTQRENPDIIVAFPTFKPERTKAIITYIDESLLVRPEKRIIWMIGEPHMDKDIREKRKRMIRKINGITKEMPSYNVCTLDYKKTLVALENIYKDKNLLFHINVSALGSKMQSLGISIFEYIRPDVSVYLATPVKYNPQQYSEGCKSIWQIDFGDLTNIRGILNKVGQLEINT